MRLPCRGTLTVRGRTRLRGGNANGCRPIKLHTSCREQSLRTSEHPKPNQDPTTSPLLVPPSGGFNSKSTEPGQTTKPSAKNTPKPHLRSQARGSKSSICVGRAMPCSQPPSPEVGNVRSGHANRLVSSESCSSDFLGTKNADGRGQGKGRKQAMPTVEHL